MKCGWLFCLRVGLPNSDIPHSYLLGRLSRPALEIRMKTGLFCGEAGVVSPFLTE